MISTSRILSLQGCDNSGKSWSVPNARSTIGTAVSDLLEGNGMSNPAIHAVTGAYGYSGKYIAQRLLDQGQTVVTLTNSLIPTNPFGDRIKASRSISTGRNCWPSNCEACR